VKAPEKRFKMKAFTGFAIGTLAVLGAVAAVFIYLKKKTEKEIAYDQFDDIMDSDEDFDDEFFDDDDEVLDPAEVMNKPEEEKPEEEKAEDAAEAETAEEKEPEAETQE
jgi:DNA-directed RNA polymerase subunit delta